MLNQRRRQRGITLVELMVGITVGMFVVAATTMLASSQLGSNRRLITETQLQQDIRATADIITRDIRRAGAVGLRATDSAIYIWTPANGTTPANDAQPNGLSSLVLGASSIEFQAQRSLGSAGPYGYKLQDGAIKTQLTDEYGAPAGWQTLTDTNIINVTQFDITTADQADIAIPCAKLCADGTQNCWPVLKVRSIVVQITAKAVNDPSVVRSVRSVAHLQNDQVNFNMSPSSAACPA